MRLDIEKLKRDMKLIPWDEFYFTILSQVAQRSTSDDRRQGAILVKNNSVIVMGYFDSYDKKGEQDKTIGSGAIENALASCGSEGISTKGATLYAYTFPNDIVCKLLVKAHIAEIIYVKPNDSVLGYELCKKEGLKLTPFKKI